MLLENETLADIEDRAEALMDADFELLEDLIEWRTKRALSQPEVASRMGVSQSAVSQFESMNGNPTLQTIRRYANAVGVRVNHIVFDDLAVATYETPNTVLRLSRTGKTKSGPGEWSTTTSGYLHKKVVA